MRPQWRIVEQAVKEAVLGMLCVSILMGTCLGIGWCLGVQKGEAKVKEKVVAAMQGGNVKPAKPIKIEGIGTFISMGRTLYWTENKKESN